MTAHTSPAFGPLELEELAPVEQAEVRAHLAACDGCARSFAGAEEALSLLADGLATVAPPPALWDRIARSVEESDALVPVVAGLLDLPEDGARGVLARMDDAGGWLDGPAPRCWYQEVPKGARRKGSLCALVKLAPGASFPQHRHLGQERTLVLRGTYQTDGGTRFAPGALHDMAPDSAHTLFAEAAGEVYYLAVVEGGVEVRGEVLRPRE
jgi:putative transcriptional regulator